MMPHYNHSSISNTRLYLFQNCCCKQTVWELSEAHYVFNINSEAWWRLWWQHWSKTIKMCLVMAKVSTQRTQSSTDCWGILVKATVDWDQAVEYKIWSTWSKQRLLHASYLNTLNLEEQSFEINAILVLSIHWLLSSSKLMSTVINRDKNLVNKRM